ncbi:hypothetical protein BDW72DRAFT_158061 [Aspergillus terricola var. indicus]
MSPLSTANISTRLAILQLFPALFTSVLCLSYPTTIEVDLLFPRNETYNNMTGFPVVFALQNADAAGTFGWDIDWQFTWLDGSEDEKFLDYYTGPQLIDSPTLNDFRYLADDILVIPGRIYRENNYYIRPGIYRVTWRYLTSTCSETESTTWIDGSTIIARANSSFIFTVVADGSGLDFEIPSDECPLYSGQWTAGSGTSTDCPDPDSKKYEDPDPCEARLSQEQISCLKDWFDGNNASEVCQSSLEKWDVLGESAAAVLAPGMAYLLLVGLVAIAVGAA